MEMEVPETTRQCGGTCSGGVPPSHRSSREDLQLRGPEAFKESQQDRVGGDLGLPPLVPPALPS